MSIDLPRKRTRSQRKGSDLLKDISDEDETQTKKFIVEGEEDREVHNIQHMKKIKDKLKNVETVNAITEAAKQKIQQEQPLKQKKEKKKKKKKDKSKEKQKQNEDEAKEEEEGSTNRKNKMLIDSEDDIKSEEKSRQKKEKKEKKSKRKHKDEQKDRERSSSKKKKHKKEKKRSEIDQQPKDEEKTANQEIDKKQKPKKKKQKDEDQPQLLPSNEEEAQADEESESKSEKEKSTKKSGKKIEKRGRKPRYIKRKKESIFERQQVINKKWRTKKRSNYLNKMSNRAWGDLRAGPYRMAKKPTKEEQRKIIDKLLGDGPKDKKSQVTEEGKEDPIKVEDQDLNQQEEQQKMEEEEIKDQQQTEKKKKKKKDKKKNTKDQSDSEGEEKPKSKSKPKKRSKKKAENENSEEKPKPKSKPKKKKKNDPEDEDEVKKQDKSTKKKKKSNATDSLEEGQQAKLEQGVDIVPKKKNKKAQNSVNSDDSDSDSDDDSAKPKEKSSKKKAKKQSDPSKTIIRKAPKQEEAEFTKEESEKIIDLFAVDGGNYPEMMKELPGTRLKKVRLHLRKLFHRALDIITYQVQHVCGRKIKEWEQDQKVQIVRELHRIRSSNRLLSQANVHFRQKMTALMRSYNDESYMQTVNKNDIETLYRRLQAFVRGYNTINRSKRTTAASITESKNKEKEGRYKFSKDITRKPIISGGHLLSKNIKAEAKDEEQFRNNEAEEKIRSMQIPQKLVEEWNRNEERTLCQLYVSNNEADEIICDNLKAKYGPSIKWRDFQLLGRKIDQLIKYALIKLQNLTARPYSRVQRRAQMQRKRAKIVQKLKREGQEQWLDFLKTKLDTTSMFSYDNQVFQKEQKLEFKHRIFKNLSLLQRQIFGHIESYKLKSALIRILIEEFPPEEDIEHAVKEAKGFSKWAREEERRNNISSIKSVFIGERDDYHSDNDSNEDSIMADIEKVKVVKPADEVREGGETSYKEESMMDEKSELFGDGSRRGGQHDTAIDIDDEEIISDFQEPQSVNSLDELQQKQPEPQFRNLQRLYATLTTSSVSNVKPEQK